MTNFIFLKTDEESSRIPLTNQIPLAFEMIENTPHISSRIEWVGEYGDGLSVEAFAWVSRLPCKPVNVTFDDVALDKISVGFYFFEFRSIHSLDLAHDRNQINLRFNLCNAFGGQSENYVDIHLDNWFEVAYESIEQP